MNDPYKDLDYRERERTQSLKRQREEAREEAREWARSVIFVALSAAALLAILWLGGAF